MTYSAATPGELLQLIYEDRAHTRYELAEITGVSRSTTNQRLDALLPTGMIIESGTVNTGGRRATTFSFNQRAGVFLAADISASRTRLAVTDLRAHLLHTRNIDLPVSEGPEAILAATGAGFLSLLEEADLSAHSVWGIGIGMPGPVEFRTGRPVEPPTMPGWDDFDVPGWFSPQFSAPVLVDQDTNVMALGAQRTQWSDADPLLLVKVGTGIGAGMINGGRIFRGAQGGAGDIGHLRLKGYREHQCRCGNTGCVEAAAGGWAIVRDLQEHRPEVRTTADLLALLHSSDAEALRLTRRAGRVIGEAIAVMVNILNPSTVVLGGMLAHATSDLLAGVREIVYQRSLPLATRGLIIDTVPPAEDTPLIGAAALMIEEIITPEKLDDLVQRLTDSPSERPAQPSP